MLEISLQLECHCGKYKRVRYKGVVCDRCCRGITIKLIDLLTIVYFLHVHVLGLSLDFPKEELLDEEIDQMIEQRNQARKERNFQLADEIREKLKEMNIILEDTPQGIRWKRG